jgi:hypothetical protein
MTAYRPGFAREEAVNTWRLLASARVFPWAAGFPDKDFPRYGLQSLFTLSQSGHSLRQLVALQQVTKVQDRHLIQQYVIGQIQFHFTNRRIDSISIWIT